MRNHFNKKPLCFYSKPFPLILLCKARQGEMVSHQATGCGKTLIQTITLTCLFFHTILSKSVGVKHVLSESKPLKLLFFSLAIGVISVIICMSVKDTVLGSPPALRMRVPEVITRAYCEGECCKGCNILNSL